MLRGLQFFRGLRGRLTLAFLIMALVPLGVISTISYQKAKASLEASTENMLGDTAEGVIGKIDLLVGTRLQDVIVMAQSPGLVGALKGGRPEEAAKLLRGFEQGYGSFRKTMLVDGHGQVVSLADAALRSQAGFKSNVAGEEWFQTACSGTPKVSDVALSPILNGPVLAIAAPVKDTSGQVIGVLGTVLPWETIEKIVDEARDGETGYCYLMSREGFLIAHPKKEKILKENVTTNENPELAAIAGRMVKGEKGQGHYSYEGVKKLTYYLPSKGSGEFKGLGWSCAMVISEKEIHAPVYALRNLMLLVISLSALAIAALTVLIAGKIVAPLVQGVAFAEAIARGDLTSTLEADRRDELGDLARALNGMRDGLGEIVGRVKETSLRLAASAGQISGSSEQLERSVRDQSSATEETSSTMVQMAASIQSVAKHADSLSGRVGEVSSSIQELGASSEQVARSSEVMASAVTETSATIEEMIVSIEKVAVNSEELAASVSETSATIEQMTVSIGEVAQNSQALQQVVAETSQVIGEMTESIRKVAGSASEADGVASIASKEAVAGRSAVQEALAGMQRLSEIITRTADSVVNLGKHSEEIGNIVQVIGQIADQTNLLALNAAIEAARAGEAGKGFAVVADEVRKLAERSVCATKEIGQVIKQVQADTMASVSYGELAAKEAQASMELSAVAGSALTNIVGNIEQSAGLIAEIAAMTEKQAAASLKVNEAVEKMSGSALQVAGAAKEQAFGGRQIRIAVEKMNGITASVTGATREQSQGGKQIRIALESMNEVTRQVSLATREQAVSSAQILEAVAVMNSMTHLVAGATSEQKKGGEMVVVATEKISGLTRENLAAVEQFAVSARELSEDSEKLTVLVDGFRVA